MSMRFNQMAGQHPAVTTLLPTLVALALLAWCNPAHAGSECPDHARAAGPGTADFVPFDPATFVGPPAPVGILFAPAMAPAAAGLRYEIEGAAREHPGAAALQPGVTRLRMVWDPDVQAELREVPAPGGGYMLDLRGAYLDLATITIGADGRPTLGCAQPARPAAPAASRPAASPRGGRE